MASSGLEESSLWLARAEETPAAAELLAGQEFYRESVSRSYYAMFYAAKAAVVSKGVRTKKHSGVIAAFGRLFAKTGTLDPRLHAALMGAFEDRGDADYLLGFAVSEEQARQSAKAARDLVKAVKSLLATEAQ